MIISNSKKFIFFHVPKTGGTSLCYNLCGYSENLDMFPMLNSVYDIIQNTDPFNIYKLQPVIDVLIQNAIRDMSPHLFSNYYAYHRHQIRWMNIFHYGFDLHPVPSCDGQFNHLFNRLGGKLFDDYFKFAFVRNPWGYVFSVFKNKVATPKSGIEVNRKNFNTFLRNLDEYANIKRNYLCRDANQYSFISDMSGRMLVDHVCRYENYNDELDFLSNRLGIEISKDVRMNQGSKTATDYRKFYNDLNVDKVSRIFATDIAQFGYTFEGDV